MKLSLTKAELAKLVRSPIEGYIVVDTEITARKGMVELTLEPVASEAPTLDASTEARR